MGACDFELESKNEHFTLYVPMEDPGMIVKGICTRGMTERYRCSGEYFDFYTSWTDTPRAVLAVSMKRILWNGMEKSISDLMRRILKYFGIMGTQDKSRINQMLLIDFKSAVRITGVETNYVLDGEKVIYWRLASRYMITFPSPRM